MHGGRLIVLALVIIGVSVLRSAEAQPGSPSQDSTARVINVDGRSTVGPLSSVYKYCVGAGRANEGLRADWQRQLKHAKQKCDFQYIRMHGLLCDDMGVYHEDHNGKQVYNWQYIDELYDFLESIHVRPFVELGFMPGQLASGDRTIFWWRGNVTPPKDYKKWADLITALVQHWVDRYGVDEVKTWYFEVWNEPNLDGFWTGGKDEYFKLYSVTAKAVKAVSPDLPVGGPSTAGNAWVPEFIDYCASTHTPLDFITTHTYGVDVGYLDEFGQHGTVLSKNPDSVSQDVRAVRKQIESSVMPKLPLHYTEWSASYTPSDPVHDSYVEAPYILDKLKNSMDYADSMSYWTFTDIFEEAGPRFTPFHGGFGMMNLQDIEKPAFRAYQYLNMLGSTQLACRDERSLAATDAAGNVQVLFWDFTNYVPEHVNNQDYYITDIKPHKKPAVALHISNLATGRYELSVYRVGYRVNDPYADYFDMGRPSQLTRDQVAQIKKHNDGAPVLTETIDIHAGETLSRTYEMRENDVYLVCANKL